jgi:hypothetical protein
MDQMDKTDQIDQTNRGGLPMLQKDLGNILGVLKVMKELELVVAELYRTCGECWLEEREFWANMEQYEVKHAQNMDSLMKMISERPQVFELGHPFKSNAVQTFISGIRANIQRLKMGEIPREKILFIARDIEQSVLESKYGEMILTKDDEFQALIRQILSDTVNHRNWLNMRIAKH